MAATVIINGLDQIQRDLAKAAPGTTAALRAGLRESAEPVSKIAETLSLREIRRMHRSPQWAETKIGVTRHAVYVVPKQRGVKTGHWDDPKRRPNLVGLMMGRSFEPALAAGAPIVESRVNILLQGVLKG